MMMMMQMWFQATTKVTLWFKEWKIDDSVWYAVSCIGLLGLCLIQEALARYRVALARQSSLSGFQSLQRAENDSSAAASPALSFWSRSPGQLGTRAAVSLLYGCNIASSYLLMLAVMTFNVGYFIIIAVGLALGHFIFYPDASSGSSMSSEACCPQPA